MISPGEVLVGCCLLDPHVADKAMQAGVSADDMPTDPLAVLWRGIVALRAAAKPVTAPGLALEIGPTCPYLAIIESEKAAGIGSEAERSITQTLYDSRVRKMIPLLGDLGIAAKAGDRGTIEALSPRLEELLKPKVMETGRAMPEAADEAIKAAEAMINGEQAKDALVWPLPAMNRCFYPIGRHELVVIGARPATGKTSIMLQVIAQAIHDKRRVAHFPLETSDVQTLHQLCSQRAEVNLRNLALETHDKRKHFLSALRHVGAGDCLRVFDRDMHINSIEARCRALRDQWKPDLVTIDYLGLIQGGHGKSLYEKVSDVANRLVELRKVMQCPVIVAAQLSRGVENEEREPRMSDLRDSGAIEQAAHRLILIYRPKDDFTGSPQIGAEVGQRSHYDGYLLQSKYRDGPIASIRSRFVSAYAKFSET